MSSTVLGKMFLLAVAVMVGVQPQVPPKFHLQEATIDHIQQAIVKGDVTTVGIVELYLKRIKAYNGVCVNEPQGILGPITTIPHAGKINALSTPKLRPSSRRTW